MTAELSELTRQVRHLTDRAAISDTLIAFARALDTRDWEGYANLYAEDGRLELPFTRPDGSQAGHVGRDGMAEYVAREVGGSWVATHHLSSNHQITIEGDTAATVSYCQCIHRPGDDPTDVWELGGWYLCRLRREESGHWKFTYVTVQMVWQNQPPPEAPQVD